MSASRSSPKTAPGLNPDEVARQIDQMRRFIESEANEKCSELQIRGQSEAQLELSRQFAIGKEAIDEEYKRRFKEHEVKRRIAASNETNANRLRILESREKALKHVQQSAFQALTQVGTPGKDYQDLLRKLILQGLLKLKEDDVLIICRKADVAEVEKVLEVCKAEYTARTKQKVNLAIDFVNSLDARSCGGVVLSAQKGKILCMNTLEQRLQLACDQQLPVIRGMLFGSRFV